MSLFDVNKSILHFSTPSVPPGTEVPSAGVPQKTPEVNWMVKDLNKFLSSLNEIYDLILAALIKVNSDTEYLLEYVDFKEIINSDKFSKNSNKKGNDKEKDSNEEGNDKVKDSNEKGNDKEKDSNKRGNDKKKELNKKDKREKEGKWDLKETYKEYFPDEKKLKKRLLSFKNFKEIYKKLDKYIPTTELLYVEKIQIGSPSDIKIIGLADLINSIATLLEKIPGLLSKRDFLEIEGLLRLQRENAIFKETEAYENSLIDPLLDLQQKIIMTRLREKLLKRIRKLKKSAKKYNITEVKLWNLDNAILKDFNI